jgi:hypothetical protein
MSSFKSAEELDEVLVRFLSEAMRDPEVGKKFAATETVFRVDYTNPDAVMWVDCRQFPPAVRLGTADEAEAVITLGMSADDGHKFWLGRLNMTTALAKRQVAVKGPVTTIMKLLPAVKPVFSRYEAYLKELGRDDLLA